MRHLWALIILWFAVTPLVHAEQPLEIFVSILPQQYFVERIGGAQVRVHTLVKPGHNPVSYEPSPRQMQDLANSHLYIRIGVPFEMSWLPRLLAQNPQLQLLDLRDGIVLRHIESHSHADEEDGHEHAAHEEHEEDAHDEHQEGLLDPHIWLSPKLVQTMAQHIASKLTELRPQQADYFQQNLQTFLNELKQLDQDIQQQLSGLKHRHFMVFHPSWGYFADAYQLEQIPIEIEGKSPGAKSLTQTIARARDEHIQVIFAQQQFEQRTAGAVAQAIGGRVIAVDPLAYDYLANLRQVSAIFVKELN